MILSFRRFANLLCHAVVVAALCFSFCTSFSSSANAAAPMTKTDALKSLRDWRARVIAEDEALVSAQKKQVAALAVVTLKRAASDVEAPLLEISRLDGDRVELEARRRIVDQIIFAIDTKWTGADLKSFLGTQLLDLAMNDLSEPGQGGWWRFLIQASISLRETAEPGADPIRFLEIYTAESNVLEPKSAFEMLKLRNYVGE